MIKLKHRHNWIDCTNDVVSDMAFCPGCSAVESLEKVELTKLSLSKLKKKYPDIPWK